MQRLEGQADDKALAAGSAVLPAATTSACSGVGKSRVGGSGTSCGTWCTVCTSAPRATADGGLGRSPDEGSSEARGSNQYGSGRIGRPGSGTRTGRLVPHQLAQSTSSPSSQSSQWERSPELAVQIARASCREKEQRSSALDPFNDT